MSKKERAAPNSAALISKGRQTVTIRAESGSIVMNEREISDAAAIANGIRRSEAVNVVGVGEMLVMLRGTGHFHALLDEGLAPDASGDGWHCEFPERKAWGLFVDSLGVSRADARRKMRIYRAAVAPHKALFEEWMAEGRIPSVRRLNWLSSEDRLGRDDAVEILEAARDLGPREWETFVNIRYRALPEGEADAKALAELGRRREAADKREATEKAVQQRRQVSPGSRPASASKSEKDEPVDIQPESVQTVNQPTGTHLRKRPRWRSASYREWVACQPCVISGEEPGKRGENHAHHLLPTGSGGDDWCNVVSVDHRIHAELHGEKGVAAILKQAWMSRSDFEDEAVKLQIRYVDWLEQRCRELQEQTKDEQDR